MATVEAYDVRRTDLRTNVLENPYWICSAAIPKEADDLACILFSFPAAVYTRGMIIIEDVLVEIVTAVAGGTVAMTVGLGSLATDSVTTGGDVTTIDVDEYMKSADITFATPAIYGGTTGNTSDWLAVKETGGSFGAPMHLTPVDTTVLCVVAYLSSDAAITAGDARVHMKISEVPGLA